MQGSRCSVPLCDGTPVGQWDTLRESSSVENTAGSLPVCELHLWILEHGGKLTLQYRG